MCPLVTSAELLSLVDAPTFLKEVLRAHPTLREHAAGHDSPVGVAQHCHGELSRGLSAAWAEHFPGTAHHTPRLGVFAPVDHDEIRADPSCTAALFLRTLRHWGTDLTTAGGVEQRVLDAVRTLILQPGDVHGWHDGVLLPNNHAVNWMLRYTPFSVLSDRIGLLFAFTGTQNG